MLKQSLLTAAFLTATALQGAAQERLLERPQVDLCGWYAALAFNQPRDHYSNDLTRMCLEGQKQAELRELRRIAIEMQMQRFRDARDRRGFGNDVTLSRTGIYLIAHRLGIFSAG